MKTINYIASYEGFKVHECSSSKVGALEALANSSVEMQNKVVRAKRNSKNEMHFIQLCMQAGINITKMFF